MSINQGEIWLVNFDPAIGSEIKKARPCIVINHNLFGRFGMKVVVPVTGWKDYFCDYPWILKLIPNDKNNLSKLSAVECFQIKSFSHERFIKKLGEVEKNFLKDIHQTILKVFNPQYSINQ
jgi:mRNA interferase MazF